MKHIQQGQEC